MGRKGVSKRKKATKEKTTPGSSSISALIGRRPEHQPALVTEKVKDSPKGKKKR